MKYFLFVFLITFTICSNVFAAPTDCTQFGSVKAVKEVNDAFILNEHDTCPSDTIPLINVETIYKCQENIWYAYNKCFLFAVGDADAFTDSTGTYKFDQNCYDVY